MEYMIDNTINLTFLWRNINISTLLFLKLFEKELYQSKYYKSNKLVNKTNTLPIHYLCYKYNMDKCYLSKDDRYLHIVFKNDDKIAVVDQLFIKSSYTTFIDRLTNISSFYSIRNIDNELIVTLKIPKKYHDDVNIIKATHSYSKVSEDFILQMHPIIKELPLVEDLFVARYITTKNIPLRIVTKSKKLAEEIVLELKTTESLAEYYIQFDPVKEYNSKYDFK